jgi:lipoprotein-anchoring transpeptidase ErfK/SrfK
MKKGFLCSMFLSVALIAAGAAAVAQESKAVEAADKTLAAIDQENKASISRQVEKAEAEKNGAKEKEGRGALATVKEEMSVSPVPAAVDQDSRPADVKSPVVISERAPVQARPGNKAGEAEMKANWDAFFSKKETSGITAYTVQPGDSLYVIAGRNHTTVDLIKKMNDLRSDTVYAGKTIRLFKGEFSIEVSKSENILTLSADGKPIKQYRVSTGKNGSTPVGEYKIVSKLVNPTWFKTGAIYPPGSPDNALGTRWLGFDLPAYGIHGTIDPENIGKPVSEGCIRMLNQDVEELYGMVPSGTKVIIKD